MTPPTRLQIWEMFWCCGLFDFATVHTAIDPSGFGGVMTPPYDGVWISGCNTPKPQKYRLFWEEAAANKYSATII